MHQMKPSEFDWNQFVERYWEKETRLFDRKQADSLPQIDAAELFSAVVACVGDYRRGGQQKVRVYVDNSEVDVLGGNHQFLLPDQSDRSFDGYNDRLVTGEGLQDYALIIADWHQFDRILWERILTAVNSLSGIVGISNSRMDTQVFVGTYKTTPFGVHSDPTSGFHFPVVGSKKMRFWPEKFAAVTPDLNGALNYERFKSKSTVATAQMGEALYWPSTEWHVAESDGKFSVTWGFGYWLGDGIKTLALHVLAGLLATSPSTREPLSSRNIEGPAWSRAPLQTLITELGTVVNDSRFMCALTQGWLKQFSASGYLRVPAMCAGLGRYDGTVELKPAYTILVAPYEIGSVLVAAGGYSEVFEDDDELRRTITELNSKRSARLTSPNGNGEGRQSSWRLLDFCYRSGTLTVTG